MLITRLRATTGVRKPTDKVFAFVPVQTGLKEIDAIRFVTIVEISALFIVRQ